MPKSLPPKERKDGNSWFSNEDLIPGFKLSLEIADGLIRYTPPFTNKSISMDLNVEDDEFDKNMFGIEGGSKKDHLQNSGKNCSNIIALGSVIS